MLEWLWGVNRNIYEIDSDWFPIYKCHVINQSEMLLDLRRGLSGMGRFERFHYLCSFESDQVRIVVSETMLLLLLAVILFQGDF